MHLLTFTPQKYFINILFILITLSLISINSQSDTQSCQISSSFSQQKQFFNHLWKHGKAAGTDTKWEESFGTLYQFNIPDIDGNDFPMEQLKGKVVVITNVACDCGFTKGGYSHMVQWKKDFETRPFEIVAFPSNSFNQETRTPAEIKQFVADKFDVKFPLMNKSDVNGDESSPVYTWLKKSFPGDITWNFSTYFLINDKGIPIARYEKESWDELRKSIESSIEQAETNEKA